MSSIQSVGEGGGDLEFVLTLQSPLGKMVVQCMVVDNVVLKHDITIDKLL